jgi:hypothetical protein
MTPLEASTGNRLTQDDFKRFRLCRLLDTRFCTEGTSPEKVIGLSKRRNRGFFLGYKGTRVVLVWKYQTRKVHEEYRVTYCESDSPRLQLEPNDLNPLLSKGSMVK